MCLTRVCSQFLFVHTCISTAASTHITRVAKLCPLENTVPVSAGCEWLLWDLQSRGLISGYEQGGATGDPGAALAAIKVTAKGSKEMLPREVDGLKRAQQGLMVGNASLRGKNVVGTGVFEAVSAAVALRPPQIVLPCADLDSGTPYLATERGLFLLWY